jgi:lysophospholipase L1-like esterase
MSDLIRDGERILAIGEQLVESDLPVGERPRGSGWVRRFGDLIAAHSPALRVTMLDRTEPSAEVHQLWERLVDDVVSLRPDRLLVSIGLADAQKSMGDSGRIERFVSFYGRLIDETRRRLPRCRITLLQPAVAVQRASPPRYADATLKAVLPFQQAVARLAAEKACGYVPVDDLFQAWFRRFGNDCFGGAEHLHPDLQGHLLIAEALSRALAPRPDRLTRASLACPAEPEPASPPVWVATGDSLTDAGRRAAYRPLGRGYVRMVDHLLRLRRPERPVRIVNTGIGSDTIEHVRARIEQDVLSHRPEALLMSIGGNDLNGTLCNQGVDLPPPKFAAAYAAFLEAVRARLPRIRIALIQPYVLSKEDLPDSYPAKVMALLPGYQQAAEDVARRFDARLVRMHDIAMEHLRSRHFLELGTDHVHLNELGSAILGESMYEAVADF